MTTDNIGEGSVQRVLLLDRTPAHHPRPRKDPHELPTVSALRKNKLHGSFVILEILC